MKTPQNVLFTVDVEKIARGMFDMFDEDEKVVLRFGMLPAGKMEILKKSLERKFREKETKFETAGTVAEPFFDPKSSDMVAILSKPNCQGTYVVEFNMKKLVDEAMHEIALEIYKIGDLVV